VDRFDADEVFVRVVERGASRCRERTWDWSARCSKQISALKRRSARTHHRTSRSIQRRRRPRLLRTALHILDDLKSATSQIGRGQTAPKASSVSPSPPRLPAFIWCRSAGVFCGLPDMAVEMAASRAHDDHRRTASIWQSTRGSPGLHAGCATIRADDDILAPLSVTSHDMARRESQTDLHRFQAVVFVERVCRAAVSFWNRTRRETSDPQRIFP